MRPKNWEASKGEPAALWNSGGSFIGHMRASSPALVTITAKGEGGQRKIGAIEDHVPPGHPRL